MNNAILAQNNTTKDVENSKALDPFKRIKATNKQTNNLGNNSSSRNQLDKDASNITEKQQQNKNVGEKLPEAEKKSIFADIDIDI